ncbi:MAG: DUF4258 domain-containing protein [Nitrososphaerales archaeon]
MEIAERIKWAVAHHQVKFTEHARVAMLDDDLITDDVMKSFQNFDVLEEYPDAKPFPACLTLCLLNDGNPLHAVIALPHEVQPATNTTMDSLIIIVTIYRPSESEWTDHRRRKL